MKSRRILIVDDNVDTARLLAMNLDAAGYIVSIVHDGSVALSAARSVPPEVVLLDIGMTGLNGYDVARSLRADAATRDALLIAVTGWAGEANRQRAIEAGFDHHLPKPVATAELVSIIEKHEWPAKS